MKLAFIVQRYGKEILGGSETLARQLAERLSKRHDITVLTTTAKDYITWKNEYEPGEETYRGVCVRRFLVEGERDISSFNEFSEEIYSGQPSHEQEIEWLNRQGPVSPELIDYLKKEHHQFDLLIFFTYLYYPTFYGLQVAPEKSILLPTAHDEPPLKLNIFKEMFRLPSSFIFNTEAEEVLVLDRFHVHKKMRETIGMGMELLDQPDPAIFRKRHNIRSKFFLYAGRIDGGKGLEELFRFFSFYKEENPASGGLQLILIGKLGMKLPKDPSIRYIGFVDEAEKLSAMGGAIATMQSSQMESLSIVTLESFSVGTPVIANANSRVLADHCRKANAGFYYRDFEEFEGIMNLVLQDRTLTRGMGVNGKRYIKANYGWEKLLAKYELALRSSARPPQGTTDSVPKEQLGNEVRKDPALGSDATEKAQNPDSPQQSFPDQEPEPPVQTEQIDTDEAVALLDESGPEVDITQNPELEEPQADGPVSTTDSSDDSDSSGEVASPDSAHLPNFYRGSPSPRSHETVQSGSSKPEIDKESFLSTETVKLQKKSSLQGDKGSVEPETEFEENDELEKEETSPSE